MSEDTVWVASGRDDRIVAVDPERAGDAVTRHETGSAPLRVAVGAGSVWTADAGDGSVTRLNPLVPESVGRRIAIGADAVVVGRRVEVGRDPQDIAVGFGSVWVANRGDGTVTQIDAGTGQVEGAPIRAGKAPGALAVTRDAVMILDTAMGDVLELTPSSRPVLQIPGFPSSIAVGGGAAWIVDSRGGTVTRVDG